MDNVQKEVTCFQNTSLPDDNTLTNILQASQCTHKEFQKSGKVGPWLILNNMCIHNTGIR